MTLTTGAMLGLVAGTMTIASVKMFGLDLEQANAQYYARLGEKKEKELKYTRAFRQMEVEDELDKMHARHIVKPGGKKEKEKAVESESSSKETNSSPVNANVNQTQRNVG
jgi:hypothetical protein